MHSLPAILMLMVALFLSSCHHREIECPAGVAGQIEVRFMWDYAPDASPDGMTLYFFPLDAYGQIWRFDIAGRDGGPVALPLGRYRLLAYNNDLSRVNFTNRDSFEDFTANAGVVSEGTVSPPGMLYAGMVEMIDITMCGVEYVKPDGSIKDCNQGLVRCYPRRLSTVYTIEVRNVSGLEYLRSASVRLDGLAPALRMVSDEPLGEAVGENVLLSPDAAASMLSGVMTGFGSAPGASEHQLTVTVTRTDGKSFAKSFDVTSQVLNSSDSKNVLIVVDGLKIPDDVTPPFAREDVGIEVGVDGWNEIIIDLTTGV
ncbi:DUF5119 domain-containing protein [uncultured Duncaniella sp.]|uniref:DUF5119 domain-containing protein n=3 Tax=uncultured Duncaniella sp. TaxID=2768039 RepID=UPI00264A16F0|nr:DUF5119 domain-containing protein [uncultured Duncaniella sp.]